MVNNYSIGGVASTLRLGKGGASIHSVRDSTSNKEIVFVADRNSSLTNIRIANPDSEDDAVPMGWVVGGNIPLGAASSGSLQFQPSDSLYFVLDALNNKLSSVREFTLSQETKLAGVQPGATKNASDAELRDRSYHTGMQSVSTIHGLGSAALKEAQVNTWDATPGALLGVGAFGVGGAAINIEFMDLDVIRPSGWYQCTTSTNGPSTKFHGLVQYEKGNQLTKQSVTDGISTWLRYYSDSAWGVWVKDIDSRNQVGSVSEGAVVERGSNNQGEYIKFADGTMICTSTSELNFISTNELSTTWAFPMEFTHVSYVNYNATSRQLMEKGTRGSYVTKTTTTATVSIFPFTNFVESDADSSLELMAFGRWK